MTYPRVLTGSDGRPKARQAKSRVGETDDALVQHVARGDRLAFARLVERHSARLMALVVRIVGNRAVAEEILQDVFTRAWISAPSWQQKPGLPHAFAAWLSRVATNLEIGRAHV